MKIFQYVVKTVQKEEELNNKKIGIKICMKRLNPC